MPTLPNIADSRRYRAEEVALLRGSVLELTGYTATRDRRKVSAGGFDRVLETITGGAASTLALRGSTERAQFDTEERAA